MFILIFVLPFVLLLVGITQLDTYVQKIPASRSFRALKKDYQQRTAFIYFQRELTTHEFSLAYTFCETKDRTVVLKILHNRYTRLSRKDKKTLKEAFDKGDLVVGDSKKRTSET